jgi:hypothetical protein
MQHSEAGEQAPLVLNISRKQIKGLTRLRYATVKAVFVLVHGGCAVTYGTGMSVWVFFSTNI